MNKQNKFFGILAILLFAIVLTAPLVLSFFMQDETGNADDDVGEKRAMSAFPTEYSNSYFSLVENWFSDHSPMRNSLINLRVDAAVSLSDVYDNSLGPFLTNLILASDNDNHSSQTEDTDSVETKRKDLEPGEPDCEHVFGEYTVTEASTCSTQGTREHTCTICGWTKVETMDFAHSMKTYKTGEASYDSYGYALMKCRLCSHWELVKTAEKTLDTTPLAPTYKSQKNDIYATAILGKRDWYFYAGDESEKYYTGDNLLTDEEMKEWKEAFEELKAELDKRGAELVILLAPNKEQMYPEYMPTTYNVKTQNKRADLFYQYMQQNSDVKYYYLKEDLEQVKLMFDPYYKQDTHWNYVGGFVGTMKFYEALGWFDTVSLYDLVSKKMITQTSRTGGDLAGFVGKSAKYTDWSITYKSKINQTGSKNYANHVTTDTKPNAELQLKTSNANSGHNLLVLGDSYRHMMEGFLIKDFDTALIAHRVELDYRTQIVMDSLEIIGPGDALLMIAVERFDKDQMEAAKKATAILKEFDQKAE